jgi:TolA-binding protein
MSMLRSARAAAAGFALWGAMAISTPAAHAQNPSGGQPSPPAQPATHQKAVKDQVEYELYNNAIKDVQLQNFAKAITDLDTWNQQYPDSDFKDDREVYYIQAYAGANQPAKAVDTAGRLLSRDLNQVFSDPKTGPQQVVKVLFTTVVAAQQIPNPTAEELATADRAAHMLMDYHTKPEGASEADWTKAREQIETAAKGALLYLAMKPGVDAMQKKDYATAGADFAQALAQYPDSGQLAYELGAAEVEQQASDPSKVSMGIYEIARGAALDPAKGGIFNPKDRAAVDAYLRKIYTTWHGSDEGLDQLKQQALASSTPPAGFHIKTSSEIAAEREAEFEKSDPELALWMKIKSQLAGANGDQYFQSQLKDTAVPQLRGTLVEAKPACHSKELLVAVPLPGPGGALEVSPQPPLNPEITLRLDAPLSGKAELNAEFHWQGIPTGFTEDPFMLTMTVEKDKLDGLRVTPCTAPAQRTTTKKD